jgi:hypothetical protein
MGALAHRAPRHIEAKRAQPAPLQPGLDGGGVFVGPRARREARKIGLRSSVAAPDASRSAARAFGQRPTCRSGQALFEVLVYAKGKPRVPAPWTRAQRALIAEFQRNARLAAERIERSPWTLGIRAARAEAELTGSSEAFDDLVTRYKKYEAERWPR